MPVLLAYAIEDSTDIFRILRGGLNTPNPPSVCHCPVENLSSGFPATLESMINSETLMLLDDKCKLQ